MSVRCASVSACDQNPTGEGPPVFNPLEEPWIGPYGCSGALELVGYLGVGLWTKLRISCERMLMATGEGDLSWQEGCGAREEMRGGVGNDGVLVKVRREHNNDRNHCILFSVCSRKI